MNVKVKEHQRYSANILSSFFLCDSFFFLCWEKIWHNLFLTKTLIFELMMSHGLMGGNRVQFIFSIEGKWNIDTKWVEHVTESRRLLLTPDTTDALYQTYIKRILLHLTSCKNKLWKQHPFVMPWKVHLCLTCLQLLFLSFIYKTIYFITSHRFISIGIKCC